MDVANRRVQFKAANGWQEPSALNAIQAVGGNVEVKIFRSGRPVLSRMWMALPVSGNQFTIDTDPTGYTTNAVIASIRPGDVAVLIAQSLFSATGRPRGALDVYGCSGCTFRNITTYSTSQFGIAGFTDSTLFERVHQIPRPGTDRLVSGFGHDQISPMGANNTWRLNRMIRTLDDGFSFLTTIAGVVKNQVGNRSATVELRPSFAMPNGSAVTFESPTGTILGSAVVISWSIISSNSSLATYFFDRDLPSGVVGAAMYSTDPAFRGDNTIIEKNAVEHQSGCCRGANIWGLTNSAFRGNYIQGTAMAGATITHFLVPTQEAPPMINFGVTNNVFDQTNSFVTGFGSFQFGAIEMSSIQPNGAPMMEVPNVNIQINNNFIAEPGTAAVWMDNSTGSVSGNNFLRPNDNPTLQFSNLPPAYNLDMRTQPLVLGSSRGVATANNTTDHTSGRMWVTDTQYRELAAYAPGATLRVNAYSLGLFPNPSVTLTDAEGNVRPVTIQKTAAHSLDIQIPASTSLGGAYITLTSESAKYFGTMFVDSVDNIPAVNGCTYEVSLSSASAPSGANNLPLLVVTQAGCSYQVLTSDSFVNPGASATGSAVISVGLAANPGAARTTTIEIAGQPITLTQAAAVPSIVVNTSFALPQLAFGGAWYTALYFSNTTNTGAAMKVDFISENGSPLSVPLAGIGSVSSRSISLNPGATVILEAPNTGDLVQGWAEANLPAGVVGYAVFRQSIPGRADQEAVVPLTSESSQTSDLAYDDTTLTTSVAFVNPSQQQVTVTATIYASDGSQIGSGSILLSPRAKKAVLLRNLPGLSGAAGQRGWATFSAPSGAISILGLRAGTEAFTSIPVTQRVGTGASSSSVALPQIAFGGGWYAALYFSNTTSSAVSIQVNFVGGNGGPLSVPILGTGSASSRTIGLNPGATAVLELPNTGDLVQGWAEAMLPPGVVGYAVFRQSVPGRADQEALVPLDSESSQTAVLVFDDSNLTTSVAFLNPSSQETTVTVTIHGQSGTQVGGTQIVLPARSRQAAILRNLPDLGAAAGQRGWARFSVTNGAVSVLGLRAGAEAFTSIPDIHQ